MRIDRRIVFAGLRNAVFGGRLSQGQVDGVEAVLTRFSARGWGDPRWLASGLQKLEHYKQGIVNQAAEAHPASAHMFIVNPLSGRGFTRLFSTHPPIEERIAALQNSAG